MVTNVIAGIAGLATGVTASQVSAGSQFEMPVAALGIGGGALGALACSWQGSPTSGIFALGLAVGSAAGLAFNMAREVSGGS